MASTAPTSLHFSSGFQLPRFLFNPRRIRTNLILLNHPFSSSSSVLTFARRRGHKPTDPPINTEKPSKKKKNPSKKRAQGDEDDDEDAFEALFRQLEEDLRNDDLSLDDEDGDITEEDLAKLERELEEALKDDELLGALDLVGDENMEDDSKEEEGKIKNVDADNTANNADWDIEEEGEQEEEDNDEEIPVKLKNWQRKRLAYALKNGRRKTNIKNLAADLCLDRAVVLQLLRDPPPDLLMMSATLPDKPASTIIEPENKLTETVPLEMTSEISKPEPVVKVPVHVMQSNWSANKRIKKAQLDTLELVYRRSKRPTNAMISNIVHLTNLPRKKVLKWFEDKRGEEGVPEHRVPYQRSPSVFT